MTDSKAWFEQGKQHERERIIALFKEHILFEDVTGTYCSCDIETYDIGYANHIMQLIKAEN